MKIGLAHNPPTRSVPGSPDAGNAVDTQVEHARQAHQLGVPTLWMGQLFSYDAITLAALVGREVPGLRVGTSAVPVIGRHPLLVGAATQTAQAATGGRFELGLALGAEGFLRPVLGVRVDRQIQLLTEFLAALRPYLDTGEVDVTGEQLSARTPFPSALPGATPPSVLVAAMGPNALRVTGELADGTITYLAGPKTLAGHVVPALRQAAAAAGRPEPRVVAAIPALVTDDPDTARDLAHQQSAFYENIPSYRAVLDREGVGRAGELAVIGGPEQVTDQLHRYLEAGATELIVTQTDLTGPDDRLRTWELIGRLAREG